VEPAPAQAGVVGFLNVSLIRRMPARRMPGSLRLAEADPLNATRYYQYKRRFDHLSLPVQVLYIPSMCMFSKAQLFFVALS
jgi:hypothetical protein